MQPKFKHDCSACTFLGHFNENDLYHCTQSVSPTVIARYGDNGSAYSSGLVFAERAAHGSELYALRVAMFIARDLGLLP